ncbi:MAG: RidA family protein [Gemmatimonadota bacterium]
MRAISTPASPAPAGHYSQAMVHAGLVFVSGQLAVEARSGRKIAGTVEEQTRIALENVAAILRAAGSDIDRVLKTTIYISDIELWGKVNEVYAEFFGSHRPARAVVPTRDLHHGLLVEIEAIAALREE